MENFTFEGMSIHGWTAPNGDIIKICISPFEEEEVDFIKKNYQKLILDFLPKLKMLFVEEFENGFSLLIDKDNGIWKEDQEDAWFAEEEGEFSELFLDEILVSK